VCVRKCLKENDRKKRQKCECFCLSVCAQNHLFFFLKRERVCVRESVFGCVQSHLFHQRDRVCVCMSYMLCVSFVCVWVLNVFLPMLKTLSFRTSLCLAKGLTTSKKWQLYKKRSFSSLLLEHRQQISWQITFLEEWEEDIIFASSDLFCTVLISKKIDT